MLRNKTPATPTLVPHTEDYKLFEYVVLVPTSAVPGKVGIQGTMYTDEEAFLESNPKGGFYVGEIDFDLNAPGLLTAIESFALGVLGDGFETCAVPMAPEEVDEEVDEEVEE